MKRKKVMLIMCVLVLVGVLNACGGSEKEQTNEQNTPMVNQNKEQDVQVSGDASTITEAPILDVEPKVYERMPEWDAFYAEYGNYYNAIQIEDMFFYAGMFGSDVIEAVANSEDTEIVAVSGDKLLNPDVAEMIRKQENFQVITYYRNDTPWFDVYVRNYSESLLPFGDCIVSLVVPYEEAMEYCRFFDGNYTKENLQAIKYSEYDDFSNILQTFNFSVAQNGNIWIVSGLGDFSPASLKKSIYWVNHPMVITLEINLDTGMVETVGVELARYSACSVYGKLIPEDFDWSSEKFVNSTLDFHKGGYAYPRPLENVELLSVFKGRNQGNFIFIFRGYESDGTLIYVTREKYNIGIDVQNQAALLSESLESGDPYIGYSETYAEALEMVEYAYKDAELICEYRNDLSNE